MHKGSWKFAKNALSNVLNGGALAIVAVVLPYFLVRYFRPAEFSVWVLILQLAAYTNFLNFGIQVAVSRYVAYAIGRNDKPAAEQTLTAGLQLLLVVGSIAFLLVVATAALLPVLFHKIDPSMVVAARTSLLWVGGALALGMPFSVYLGVFLGLQRNDIPALISVISKTGLALAVVWVAGHTGDLVQTARAFFFASVAGYILQYVFFRAMCRDWQSTPWAQLGPMRRELISYCTSLAVWSVAGLLITGCDTTVVGIFDFKNVGAYGVTANIIAMFTGLIRSVSSPLIQVFARYHARDDKAALMKLLNFTSLAITVAVLALAYWSTQLAGPLFQWWIGPQLARVAVPVFALLIFANGMRLWCAPYVNYLVGVGLQREIYLSPIVEGIANLGASIVLAIMIGAIGVAWGTVIGAVLGVGAQYFYNFPRTMPADFRFRNFFNANILAPLVVTAPMLGVLCLTEFYHVSLYICGPAMAAAFIPSMIFVRREYGRTIKGLSREAKSTFEQEIPELASSDT